MENQVRRMLERVEGRLVGSTQAGHCIVPYDHDILLKKWHYTSTLKGKTLIYSEIAPPHLTL